MDDDAGLRKRKRHGETGADIAGKVEDGKEEEEEEEYEGISEESVVEVMRWLEMEISLTAAAPALVTVSGNEESCGPSFSDSASTVMASVDTRAGAPPPPAVPWPWPAVPTVGEEEVDVEDEEWVAQVLTCGPMLEGQ